MTTTAPHIYTPATFIVAVQGAATPGQLTSLLATFRRSEGMGRVGIDWQVDDSLATYDACKRAIYNRAEVLGFTQHAHSKAFEKR